MKKKPTGQKYQNLLARDGVIYYKRTFDGKRVRFSTKTADWDAAAAMRDMYEQRRAARRFSPDETPTFVEMERRYLKEAAGHLSGTTLDDRKRVLGEDCFLTRYFGAAKIDAVQRPQLLEWWHTEVEGKGRSERTGLTYLSALSAHCRASSVTPLTWS